MKNIRILLLLLITFNVKADDNFLSLAFHEASVAQVLQALAEFQQVNLVIAPGVEGKVSLKLEKVPWQQALSLVSKLAGLHVEQDGKIWLVYSEKEWRQQQDSVFEAQKSALKQQPLKTLRLPLKNSDANTMGSRLQTERAKLMTERGSVTVDTRTNSLLLRDTPAAVEEVSGWIKAQDQAIEQVELVAHIVSINRENLRELGVSWSATENPALTRSLGDSGVNINLEALQPTLTAGFVLGKINGRLLEMELSALERENQVNIIASPRLMTSHQQTASIKQGTEIPYEVSSGNNGGTSIEFKEAVLGMEVTPVVQSDERILLKLQISQNVPGRSVMLGKSEVLSIKKQEIQTQVTLKNGQTLALGGVFEQENNTGRDKVPFLGNIPLLGALFRHDSQGSKRRELVIFITPRLVKDSE